MSIDPNSAAAVEWASTHTPNDCVIDWYSSDANIYGCTPCPQCGSVYRYEFVGQPEFVQCDDCGLVEAVTERRG